MPEAVIHPTPQELTDFGLGKLPERAAAVVAAHTEICPACRQAVAGVSADSFLDKVRAAKPEGSSIPPNLAQQGNDLQNEAQLDMPAGAFSDLPPSLAHHPKYSILRELGRGGMGVVYLARHVEMDRPVVIKVINLALLDRPDSLERFRREIRAAAQLSHPNIVTAYDAEQAGDAHMLVMEFVPGQTLAEVLNKKGALPVPYACHFARQVALGLQHACEVGMVHRDIKPQNLMLTPKGQVKILDFGLAKVVQEENTSTGLTAINSYIGTPDFCAPEQATDARTADIRADLYSLGCTLYYLLSGFPPFREDNVVKTILAHQQKEAQPLPELRADVPAELWQVVARLLSKNPNQRFQKPIEVAQALVPFIKSGAKQELKGASAVPLGEGAPRKGTVIAVDTGKIKKILRDVSGKAPQREVPAQKEKSQFKVLEDAPALPKRTKKATELTKGLPAVWNRHWPVPTFAGVAALVLIGAALIQTASIKTRKAQNHHQGSVQPLGNGQESVREVRLPQLKQPMNEVVADSKTLLLNVSHEERRDLVDTAKKNANNPKADIEHRPLRQLADYEKELARFLAEQGRIEKTENDPRLKKWLSGIQSATLLEKELEIDKALKIYERIQKEGYPDKGGELDKHLVNLHKLWEPQDNEHKDARGFIYRLWPNLDTKRLEENIPEAHDAFKKCQEAGDLISIQMLLKGTKEHADRLAKQFAELKPDLVIDDEKEALQLNKVGDQIVKLAGKIQDYLKVHSYDTHWMAWQVHSYDTHWMAWQTSQVKKPRVEEEPPKTKQQAGKRKRVEEEEDSPRKKPKKRVILVPDEEDNTKAKPAASRPTDPAGGSDLTQLAEKASRPVIKELFRSLAVPYDHVLFKKTNVTINRERIQREEKIQPYKFYIGNDPDRYRTERLRFTPLTQDWQPDTPISVYPPSLDSVRPYEEIAKDKVRQFLRANTPAPSLEDPNPLPSFETYVAAEKALSAVLRWHESARQTGRRIGDEWKSVEDKLRRQLLDEVLLEQMKIHAQAKDWDRVMDLAHRLSRTFNNADEGERILGPVAEMIQSVLKNPTGSAREKQQVIKRLHDLEKEFPGTPVLRQLGDQLREIEKQRKVIPDEERGEAKRK